MAPMQVIVNGQEQHCPPGSTLADLIMQLGLTGKRLAVERNRVLVPRSQHAQVFLEQADRLEIVVAVGGG